MARIILPKQNVNVNNYKQQNFSTGFTNDRDLFKKRSRKYLDILSGLDVESLTDAKGLLDVISVVQEEFGTADIASLPLGILAKCFLGHPYEVHMLDISGSQIIKHYKIGESLPDDFEKARILAKHNAYLLIEVYRDKLMLIREDGSATKV